MLKIVERTDGRKEDEKKKKDGEDEMEKKKIWGKGGGMEWKEIRSRVVRVNCKAMGGQIIGSAP